ncbi:MAG: short-chain dehydrogenase [Phycisphaeraceae bacterium]|nr:short-chain dehydrogenase [Phycisphaeraceae bacterium]
MKVDLEGQIALVSGAAQGIGRAIADTLAANGATVVYTDINEPVLEQAAANAPGAAHGMVMDVSDETQVDRVVSDIVARHGRLDIAVSNAGVNTLAHRVTIDEFPLDEWNRIHDVDSNGVFLVGRAAARVMKKAGSGRIINIASIAGLVPIRLQCAFAAAKAGVINLTKAMAIELGNDGVLVNAVAPGSTLTDATKKLFYGEDGAFSEKAQQLLSHVPLGRPGTVDEIAHAVLFLAAPESSYITGNVITVDGGWIAGFARDF